MVKNFDYIVRKIELSLLKSILFENSKQKFNSNQTTQIMKIIKINKIFGTKNMQQKYKISSL